jgi:hypothetical protein
MAWVNYQRILDGTSVSGKFGESLQITERWQIRVDSPSTSKADILTGVSTTSGVTWGSSHFEFPALKAMEFELAPEGKDGMRWLLTVKYYVPSPTKTPQENGIPADVWERGGGTTTIPAFTDSSGDTITNAAGDPLEGLEKEREETSWTLTKYYEDQASLDSAIASYAGKVNSAGWAGEDEKTWKCYFKGAKRQSVSKLDGVDDAGTLDFIESRWEFRLEVDTWKAMPWDVGFMELVSGSRKTITSSDGKPVKQPVALNSDGTKKTAGSAPDVINGGAGVDLYLTADWSGEFGTPELI